MGRLNADIGMKVPLRPLKSSSSQTRPVLPSLTSRFEGIFKGEADEALRYDEVIAASVPASIPALNAKRYPYPQDKTWKRLSPGKVEEYRQNNSLCRNLGTSPTRPRSSWKDLQSSTTSLRLQKKKCSGSCAYWTVLHPREPNSQKTALRDNQLSGYLKHRSL